jgi:AcrR family transcriptional regulator
MARMRHSDQAILDAAADLLVGSGPRAATIDAIAAASGAPKGSIYYRFRSRDEIFACLWLRAVEGLHAALLAPADDDTPLEATVAAALAVYDFCNARRADAWLLLSFRPQDLWGDGLRADLQGRLAEADDAIARAQLDMAKRLYGNASPAALGRLRRAVLDIPLGVAREHVTAGGPPPPGARVDLERAVRAVLAAGPNGATGVANE